MSNRHEPEQRITNLESDVARLDEEIKALKGKTPLDARLPSVQKAKLERSEKQRLIDDISDLIYDTWHEAANNAIPDWDRSSAKKFRERMLERLGNML